MKVLFFGLGSIGTRHARLLLERGGHELHAFRSSRGGPNALDIPEIHDWSEVDALQAKVAFITNPTDLHIETALECARRNMAIFLEKPIGCSVAGLSDLVTVILENRLPSYVAYVLRFHPAVNALKECLQGARVYHMRLTCTSHLPSWRPGQDCRLSYAAQKRRGGGALLEISHEFDTAEYLLGEIGQLRGNVTRQTEITMDAEDCVDGVMTAGGVLVNIHLNFISHRHQRTIAVDASNGHWEADLITCRLIHVSDTGRWEKEIPFERDDMYRNQLSYFLDHIDDINMMNSIPSAERLFRKLISFREESFR